MWCLERNLDQLPRCLAVECVWIFFEHAKLQILRPLDRCVAEHLGAKEF
jgi:hypothetical protein